MKNIIGDIAEKEFKQSLKGYNKNEVDDFLNEILDIIEPLLVKKETEEMKFEQMEIENFKLKKEIITLKNKIKEEEKAYIDKQYIREKKIEQLEKELYVLKSEGGENV